MNTISVAADNFQPVNANAAPDKVVVRNLDFFYGGFRALKDINLSL